VESTIRLKVKKIGITGSIGAGKSSFCKFLKQWAYPVISADDYSQLAFQPHSPLLPQILKVFKSPPQPLTSEWIAEQIFSDSKTKALVEKYTHPFILDKILEEEEKIKIQNPKLIFYEIPLLFETKMEKNFDHVILICCSEKNQNKRVMNRFQLTQEQAQKRIKSQMPQEEKLSKSDFVIHNNKTLDDLKNKAQIFLKKIENTL